LTGSKLNVLLAHKAAVKCMIVTPDENWFISGSEDNEIII
jgi:WD domain, G-beta repeat.